MIDWQNIDTVFLDMDGTLLDLNFDNHFWQEFVPVRYATRHGMSLETARNHLFPRFREMEGKLEWYCLDYWTRELQLDLAGMKTEVAGLVAVLPHVVEFLGFLRSTGKRVVLATNAHPRSLSIKMEQSCLHVFFDRIITSHQFGHPKEHNRFWHDLQAAEPFDVGRTVLVDDSLPVLRAARAYGLEHLVAVRLNDSRLPPKAVEDFMSILDFRELMPSV